MTTKAYRKPRACVIVAVFCALTTMILMIGLVASQTFGYKKMEIIDDLPIKSDMEKYMFAVEKAVNFMRKNTHFVDLNVCFGIFLAYVQFQNSIRSQKRKDLRLEHLAKLTDSIVVNFTKELAIYEANYPDKLDPYSNIVDLFIGNDTSWHRLLPNYNIDLLKRTKFYQRKDLEKLYFKWPQYQKLVYGPENRKHSAKSDACLSSLAQNPTNHDDAWTHCQVPYKCLSLVLNGTEFGYALTHRALFLLLARFGRGCNLLSPAADRAMLDSFCLRLYNEAEFIAYHDFLTSDIIIEIIAICSLDGNSQFLRRSWIDELLDFQTEFGCFNVSRPEVNVVLPQMTEATKYNRKLFLDDQMILWGTCNSHTTSVAIAMLASAIRYIAQNYA